jgi:tRNA threonylcarbamoyladenosine biosynthesis protein TsaE
MKPSRILIITRSVHQTQRLGECLGRLCRPDTVLALTGDLGCGKTTLVQGLARGLDVPADYYITSPTYTWINEYPGRMPLFHADLYRLTAPEEIEDIGLPEIFHAGGTLAVEWADRIEGLLPDRRLTLSMETVEDTLREIRVSARSDEMVTILDKLNIWIKEQKWV